MNLRYPHIFSMPLIVAPDSAASKIPRSYSKEFSISAARLDGMSQDFILASPKGRPAMIPSRTLVNAISKVDSRRVVIYSPYLDSGLMRALASEGIAYIRDSQNVFLPFLGMAASPVYEYAAPAALSPRSQRIILNLIAGRWNGLTATELAEACEVSRASITKCLDEIVAICPALLSSEGKRKRLRNPGISKDELIGIFEPYFIHPLKGRISLKGEDTLDELRRAGALLCGECAMAFFTDLAFVSRPIQLAMFYKDIPAFHQALEKDWVEAKWFEDADIVIEEWSYELDGADSISLASTGFRSLDSLGLYVEMRGKAGEDMRLADAVEQVKETACL